MVEDVETNKTALSQTCALQNLMMAFWGPRPLTNPHIYSREIPMI